MDGMAKVKPLDITCGYCQAFKDAPCKRADGKPLAGGKFHAARVRNADIDTERNASLDRYLARAEREEQPTN